MNRNINSNSIFLNNDTLAQCLANIKIISGANVGPTLTLAQRYAYMYEQKYIGPILVINIGQTWTFHWFYIGQCLCWANVGQILTLAQRNSYEQKYVGPTSTANIGPMKLFCWQNDVGSMFDYVGLILVQCFNIHGQDIGPMLGQFLHWPNIRPISKSTLGQCWQPMLVQWKCSVGPTLVLCCDAVMNTVSERGAVCLKTIPFTSEWKSYYNRPCQKWWLQLRLPLDFCVIVRWNGLSNRSRGCSCH